jgi:predicted HTH transcriptional regulator
MKQLIFVSSVQKELTKERQAIRDFIRGNRLLGKHFDVFIFEDLPAKNRRPDDMYLDKVEACSVFIAMFAAEYGSEDPKDGLSPTEREFNLATKLGRHRLLFLKNADKHTKSHPKMASLIKRATAELIYKRFNTAADLTSLLYDSLVEYLEERGTIQSKPFDAAPCRGADLDDISDAKIKWFLTIARRERNLNLPASATKRDTLTHLKLADEHGLTNAAILLFGDGPQKYASAAVIKCAHYHGIEVAKPIPSHQLFDGTLFEQVDGAVDFVMSKLARSVGRRTAAAAAPVKYEIPMEAIREIIINAVAHRDYVSSASVQVSIFADRIEVWNPGSLPCGLRPEDLAKPHSSEPANPLIAAPLYLAHYIESLGTGTLDVIRHCRESDLPSPQFEQRGNQFVVTLWRDWLTTDVLLGLDLNDRQRKVIAHVKTAGRIGNREYQRLTGAIKRTATRDLDDLVARHLLTKVGATGRGVHYVLARKGDIKGTNGTSAAAILQGDIKGTNETSARAHVNHATNVSNRPSARKKAQKTGISRNRTATGRSRKKTTEKMLK